MPAGIDVNQVKNRRADHDVLVSIITGRINRHNGTRSRVELQAADFRVSKLFVEITADQSKLGSESCNSICILATVRLLCAHF